MQSPNTMARLAIIFVLVFIVSITQFTRPQKQPIKPRHDYGAQLEPRGRILNGAGQDWPAFVNYWNLMQPNDKPAVYMTYIGLRDARSDWTEELKRQLLSLRDRFVIPQIGLSMTIDGEPSAHYEQNVATGLYDNEIGMFLDGLQALAVPAYVRIGYEFNGTRWNGYRSDSYRKAFVRITDSIRARNLEVATVWNFSMDGDVNFEDYYPGDVYVDWWGINVSTARDFSRAIGSRFLDSAHVHQKPVMIGESTPRRVGVLNGIQSWDHWFAPFFAFVHTNPGVKMFCYINWDWSQYPPWQNWGDARLEQNAVVGSLFVAEMDSSQYLHASPERAFRKTLGSSDTLAPPTPSNLSVITNEFPTTLSWKPVADPSGLSHYVVYKNGSLADYTLTLAFHDFDIAAGESIAYAISAMDRAGNESPLSKTLSVIIAPQLNKPINGEFDEGVNAWWEDTQNNGSFSTFEIDTTYAVSGRNSARVTITKVGRTSSDIMLYQVLKVMKGRKYRLTFEGKSSIPKGVDLALMGRAAYYARRFNLTPVVQCFTDSVTIHTTDHIYLEFNLGQPPTGVVWIDAVSLLESR
jgi:hypothetical protein